VSARVPSNIQRAARARAETLGVSYGQYLIDLITRDTADNVGPLIAEIDRQSSPESEAAAT